MKLCLQLPLALRPDSPAFRPYYDLLARAFNRAKRPDTEVVARPISSRLCRPGQYLYPAFRFFNDPEIVKEMMRAEGEGFDAVVSGCFFDPGIEAAKQLLAIPVVGSAQASMHQACLMGASFAVITSEVDFVPHMLEEVARYGLSSRLIQRQPVRSISLTGSQVAACFSGDHGAVVEDFGRVARGCIADGAEVVIAGCGLISPMLTEAGVHQIDNVPVVDPLLCGIKTAELMVDLQKAGHPVISRKGFYMRPPQADLDALREKLLKGG